ncbi:hypothetical protein KY290_010473 [Solanum tuberosum]|uniref:RBR-type E3 ubiquitin transferase n=1 Tax=Solanum tuberosum TaxID=4113 RepID=A0ABQ7VXV9_SOLTU|nr:hypothetical protein KY284_012255 [Solanum tuberosum]KAH0773336.1 hypothetical protein KY290_010473 [Solanum tuberosum]
MKRPIISKFLQLKPKIENKGCSSSRWSKNFRRLHRRHKIQRSTGANDAEMESTNLQIVNSNQVEMESTDLQIANPNQVEMESTDLQILDSSEVEVDPTSLNSDVIAITENNNGYKSGDDDIELQTILFYSAQFHSGKNLESSSNHGVGKKPMEIDYSVIPDSLNLKNSITEKGESSCTFCEICKDVFPLPNTMMWGTNCNHRYCVECIHNYIGKKINEVIHEVSIRCPASDCKEILDINLIMPIDFLIRVRDASRLMKVLASPLVIDCPYMDCMGKLIDDQQGYPIRACPKCWKIFCVNCKSLHFGMTCEIYQFSRQLNLLYWQQQYGGYHDELEDEEEREQEEEERGGEEEE